MKLPHSPPSEQRGLPTSPERFAKVFQHSEAEPGGHYLHWDEMRRRTPPDDLTHEEWWLAVSIARTPFFKPCGLRTSTGELFKFAMTETAQSLAHRIDRDASGVIAAPDAITNKATQKKYLVSSLIEEALTSSQLEGAVATRAQAKQIINEGRPPRTRSERMVLNNYEAMELIRERRDEPLTPRLLLDLHRTISEDTLDSPDQVGRLRRAEDDVKVFSDDGTVVHVPPSASELPERIELLCEFANASNGKGKGFIHPVVRAILLHFWLAYDHPFCDGNGRTARALFYWAMLKNGYWLTEYVSISRVLKLAPAKYARSFLHSETAPYDATYFVLHQLEVITRSIIDLHAYLGGQMAEVRSVEALLREHTLTDELNHRQVGLLSHALRNPGEIYTMSSHKNAHGVVHQTARTDLIGLVNAGFLTSRKRGREFEFRAVPDLADLLRRKRGR